VGTVDGLPFAGTPTAVLSTDLKEPAEGRALRFGAGQNPAYRSSLRLDPALIRLKSGAVGNATSSSCTVLGTGQNVRAGASGWVRSTGPDDPTGPLSVDACGTARTSPVSVLATDFASDGVVRVQLLGASARCQVSGVNHAPSASYSYTAVVQRWTPTGYVTVATVDPSSTTDALAGVDLATTPVGGYGVLGDWIQSWSALVPDRVRTTLRTGESAVVVPGVVKVQTVPLRHRVNPVTGELIRDENGAPVLEPASTLSLTLGALTCHAQDAR
jgi:hypothetical protein